MPVAKIETPKKKNISLLLTLLVLSTGLISAAVFVLLPHNQASKTPAATVACPAQGASCQWPTAGSGVEYQYSITDMTTGESVVAGKTTDTKVAFTPLVDHRYRCSVKTINSCGTSPESVAEGTAGIAAESPAGQIPLGGATATPIASPSGSLSSASPSATLIPTAVKPTPTTVGQSSPTPTRIVIVAATNTPGPSTTPQASGSPTSSTTTEPTTTSLPQTGVLTPLTIFFTVASIAIVFGLIL